MCPSSRSARPARDSNLLPPRAGAVLLLGSTARWVQEDLEKVSEKLPFGRTVHMSFSHQQQAMGRSEGGPGCGSAHSNSTRDPVVLTCVVVPGSNLFWGDSIERLRDSTGPGLVTSLWSLEKVPVLIHHETAMFLPEPVPDSMSGLLHGICLMCALPTSLHHRQGSLHRPPVQGLPEAQQCSKSPQGYRSQHWPMTSCPSPPWPRGRRRDGRAAQVLPYLSHVTDDYCHDDPVDGHGLAENDAVGERQSLSTASQSV